MTKAKPNVNVPLLEVGAAEKAGQLVGWLYDFKGLVEAPLAVHTLRSGYSMLKLFQAPIKKATRCWSSFRRRSTNGY